MSLIHAVVAQEGVVLAEESQAGKQNYSEATETILSKIPSGNSKLTYVWEQYLFHYVSENGYTYLVMSEDKAGRRMPFAFLSDLQKKFLGSSTTSSSSSSSPSRHSLQRTFGPTISALLHTYNTAPPEDELTRAQAELSQVKDIMVQNVEQILSRGERIELLVDKTDHMAGQAQQFRRGARTVRRQMWWQNSRVIALGVLLAVLIMYLLVAQACGLGLNHCGLQT